MESNSDTVERTPTFPSLDGKASDFTKRADGMVQSYLDDEWAKLVLESSGDTGIIGGTQVDSSAIWKAPGNSDTTKKTSKSDRVESFSEALKSKPDTWASLSYLLRRHIDKTFGLADIYEKYRETALDMAKEDFIQKALSPELPEKDAYVISNVLAETLFLETSKAFKGTNFRTIPKADYDGYLRGSKAIRVKGDVLHRMALALKFDIDTLVKVFAITTGEPPFNWHNAEDCIYYYVLRTNGSAADAERLIKEYAKQKRDFSLSDSPAVSADIDTPAFRSGLDEKAGMDTEDSEARENSFIQYICGKEFYFKSSTQSRIAREEFSNLYAEVKKLVPDIDQKIENSGLFKDIASVTEVKPQKDDLDAVSNHKPQKNRPESAVVQELLQIPVNDRRFRYLRNGNDIVRKRDIVVLNFLKEVALRDTKMQQYKNSVKNWTGSLELWRKNLVKKWRKDTDDILVKCGLPVIYSPCRFDSLVLVALASEKPSQYILDVMAYLHED